MSLKQIADQHPLAVLATVAAASVGIGWAVCDSLYVKPRDYDLSKLRGQLEDAEKRSVEERASCKRELSASRTKATCEPCKICDPPKKDETLKEQVERLRRTVKEAAELRARQDAVAELARLSRERRVELKNLNIQAANFKTAFPVGALPLSGANFTAVDLSNAVLDDADLQQASLSSATLIGASLRRANLRWADLSGAKLRGANLTGAKLQGARNVTVEQFEQTCWDETTTFPEGLQPQAPVCPREYTSR